jgi:hypothetical protein
MAHDTHQVSRLRNEREKRANILKSECGKFFERPSNHILQMHYEFQEIFEECNCTLISRAQK